MKNIRTTYDGNCIDRSIPVIFGGHMKGLSAPERAKRLELLEDMQRGRKPKSGYEGAKERIAQLEDKVAVLEAQNKMLREDIKKLEQELKK